MEKPDAEIASERVAAERDEEDAGAKSSPPDGRKTPARGDINRASVNDAGVSARAGVEVDAAKHGEVDEAVKANEKEKARLARKGARARASYG